MANNVIPAWIEAKLFENILRETVKDFQEIIEFKVFPALAPGENYATVMLKVQIEVLLKNQSRQMESFMLKVPHDTELYHKEMSKWDLFTVESGMYRTIKPELEKFYADAGVKVHFGAQSYKLPIKKEYILLEDLSKRGFRNAKRQNCLDMNHCKGVLKKIAQFHAASAVRVAQRGMFDQIYLTGMLNDIGKDLVRSMFDNAIPYILKTVAKFDNSQQYYKQVEFLSTNLTDILYKEGSLDESEFNVLNHGDCWSNNIMFRYDKEGNLEETYLVDLQIPRYGTPAQDLLYFIISSAQLDIKVDKFDYMIKYYHDQLIEHLKLLKYTKPLPSLRDIHRALIKYSIWAVMTIIIMAAVLCDPTDAANMDNFAGDSKEGQKFKEVMYSNERFAKYLEALLPWLLYRGSLEFN